MVDWEGFGSEEQSESSRSLILDPNFLKFLQYAAKRHPLSRVTRYQRPSLHSTHHTDSSSQPSGSSCQPPSPDSQGHAVSCKHDYLTLVLLQACFLKTHLLGLFQLFTADMLVYLDDLYILTAESG